MIQSASDFQPLPAIRQFAQDLYSGCDTHSDRDTHTHSRSRLTVFAVAWFAQLATILVTWPTWNARSEPANLPIVGLPAISFAPLVLLSLLAVWVRPKKGLILHGIVMLVALAFDVQRLAPQFIALWVLLWACISKRGEWFAYWFLATMWIWTSVHKLLSPAWFGETSWGILTRAGFDPELYIVFAWLIIVAEFSLGWAAIIRPPLAARLCLILHLGILLFLSPLFYGGNVSVWPWNLAIAVVGAAILWNRQAEFPAGIGQWLVVMLLFTLPGLYYVGGMHPRLAHVLYSGNMPKAWMTTKDQRHPLHGWVGLRVPFPDSHLTFRHAFRTLAAPGDKMYVQDPRPLVKDAYYVMADDRQVQKIGRAQFLLSEKSANQSNPVKGCEFDDANAVFLLNNRGAALTQSKDLQVVKAEFRQTQINDLELSLLAKLPNLKELSITKANILSEDTGALSRLWQLETIDLSESKISDRAVASLDALPKLGWVNLSRTNISNAALSSGGYAKLRVLHLAGTHIDDQGLSEVARMRKLVWLDLAETAITSRGMKYLCGLDKLEWIDLSGTAIDDSACAYLVKLPKLEILALNRTGITDVGLEILSSAPMLESLELRETATTPAGRSRLKKTLPAYKAKR